VRHNESRRKRQSKRLKKQFGQRAFGELARTILRCNASDAVVRKESRTLRKTLRRDKRAWDALEERAKRGALRLSNGCYAPQTHASGQTNGRVRMPDNGRRKKYLLGFLKISHLQTPEIYKFPPLISAADGVVEVGNEQEWPSRTKIFLEDVGRERKRGTLLPTPSWGSTVHPF